MSLNILRNENSMPTPLSIRTHLNRSVSHDTAKGRELCQTSTKKDRGGSGGPGGLLMLGGFFLATSRVYHRPGVRLFGIEQRPR